MHLSACKDELVPCDESPEVHVEACVAGLFAPGASKRHRQSGAAIERWRLCFDKNVGPRMRTDESQVGDLGRDISSLELLFPSLDQALLRDVLHQCGGSIKIASSALIDMVPSVQPRSSTEKVSPVGSPCRW